MAAKDYEATTKYRFDPKLATGGTLGVNFATLGGAMLSFNYRSIYMSEAERVEVHQRLVVDHYLKQFNEETIATKQQHTCGEPCAAVCKKMRAEFKKDYEPYETMGPQCGIFDQRAAETADASRRRAGLRRHLGRRRAVLAVRLPPPGRRSRRQTWAWRRLPSLRRTTSAWWRIPRTTPRSASPCSTLSWTADSISARAHGAGRAGWRASRAERSSTFSSTMPLPARDGWCPIRYWTPGVLAPMPIMGKYYMYYGPDFLPPRQLGRMNAERLVQELMMDNLGICRFHRGWAEEMGPEIVEAVFANGQSFADKTKMTASRINSRNSSVFWEAGRNTDLVRTFLQRQREVADVHRPELDEWIARFERNSRDAALDFWYEMHKGAHESLLEF